MSQTNGVEDVKEKEGMNESEKIQVDDEKYQIFGEEFSVSKELKDEDENENEKNLMPSAREEEEAIKKKYGGFLPKKTTLISKNHDRAFFDSADWALGKQGAQKPKGPLEALRPKLQPSPHQQMRSRRSAYAPAADENEEASSSEDQSCTLDGDNDNTNTAKEDQINDNGSLHET
ncbi:CAMP-regulated phosphoprotein 19-related protein, putative isoform 2 [Hibiscus syriacus]|uniref:cAMP-regulated phosphoprotein 19-related protein, putative isoform 2 n=1 Tax=Hibiscus syriacus TaxID=106335 RepID=A0A6A2Z6N3_HIBSY|nr:uncharacterized protein LOC120150403 isoform X2 [Hibiscus syriacus]KAE8687347.1 CAMP-regulated phosphoprotein 19-related protein, putative isoform 2 [Hibiscus syriacus]